MTQHSKGESIAGDSGEGHSPPIESLCPVYVVTIQLAQLIWRHRQVQDPTESPLILFRLGSKEGASKREQSWEEPSGTALPLLMIVLLEVPWHAWVFFGRGIEDVKENREGRYRTQYLGIKGWLESLQGVYLEVKG